MSCYLILRMNVCRTRLALPPGTVFSLSLDQDLLGCFGQQQHCLVKNGFTTSGSRRSTVVSDGVAASGGRAIVADWYQSVLEQVDDRWGAEVISNLHAVSRRGIYFSALWVPI